MKYMKMAPAAGDLQDGSGALGKLGTYSEAITSDGHIKGAASISGDIIASIPGAMVVSGSLQLTLDPVAVILFEAQKIKNPVADWLAKELLAMRAGAAPSPAAAQAAAAAPVAPGN